jgi:hypothetical protein
MGNRSCDPNATSSTSRRRAREALGKIDDTRGPPFYGVHIIDSINKHGERITSQTTYTVIRTEDTTLPISNSSQEIITGKIVECVIHVSKVIGIYKR